MQCSTIYRKTIENSYIMFLSRSRYFFIAMKIIYHIIRNIPRQNWTTYWLSAGRMQYSFKKIKNRLKKPTKQDLIDSARRSHKNRISEMQIIIQNITLLCSIYSRKSKQFLSIFLEEYFKIRWNIFFSRRCMKKFNAFKEYYFCLNKMFLSVSFSRFCFCIHRQLAYYLQNSFHCKKMF